MEILRFCRSLCAPWSLWLISFSRLLLIGLLGVGFVARSAYAAPIIEHWVAPSGARVFLVENHDLPMLDVQVDFAAGTAYDPPDKPGLAALTGALLDLGLPDLDETQIAGRLADLGAQLSGGVDMDRASLRLRTLSADEQRVPAFDLLRAILAGPTFPSAVLAREQARTVAALKEALTQPAPIASRAFWSALYPQHAYGRQATPESVSQLQRDDLVEFHRRHYTAAQAAVTFVGDVSRAQAEALADELTAAL
ncbi:MAG: insulinase family protein, partial [Propionivibrio sp.]